MPAGVRFSETEQWVGEFFVECELSCYTCRGKRGLFDGGRRLVCSPGCGRGEDIDGLCGRFRRCLASLRSGIWRAFVSRMWDLPQA